MALNLIDLKPDIRRYMVEELDADLAQGSLYLSPRLSNRGSADYPNLLRAALTQGDDSSLAATLSTEGFLKTHETRTRGDKTYTARVPRNAAETLAEGEFNRFYLRRLCRFALDTAIDYLIIYRAKEVHEPRPESEAKIGTRISAQLLLDDLRAHPGVDTALGLPPGPNSGLNARLP